MSFALGIIPVVLLLLGFPIFLVLLTRIEVERLFCLQVPRAATHKLASIDEDPELNRRHTIPHDEDNLRQSVERYLYT